MSLYYNPGKSMSKKLSVASWLPVVTKQFNRKMAMCILWYTLGAKIDICLMACHIENVHTDRANRGYTTYGVSL